MTLSPDCQPVELLPHHAVTLNLVSTTGYTEKHTRLVEAIHEEARVRGVILSTGLEDDICRNCPRNPESPTYGTRRFINIDDCLPNERDLGAEIKYRELLSGMLSRGEGGVTSLSPEEYSRLSCLKESTEWFVELLDLQEELRGE